MLKGNTYCKIINQTRQRENFQAWNLFFLSEKNPKSNPGIPVAGTRTRRSGGHQLSTFSSSAATAPEESLLGTAAFALPDLLTPRGIQEPNHFFSFLVSSSNPKLMSRPQDVLGEATWGTLSSSFPPHPLRVSLQGRARRRRLLWKPL